jgi:hypothetical protein
VVAVVNTYQRRYAIQAAQEVLTWRLVASQVVEDDERADVRRKLAEAEGKLKDKVRGAFRHYVYLTRKRDQLEAVFIDDSGLVAEGAEETNNSFVLSLGFRSFAIVLGLKYSDSVGDRFPGFAGDPTWVDSSLQGHHCGSRSRVLWNHFHRRHLTLLVYGALEQLMARDCQPISVTVTVTLISSLLINLVLDELDWELERRSHRFVRYADDCNIYVRNEQAGQRTMESITQFITQKLKLKVNETKSAVARPQQRKFLGFSFTTGPEVKRRIAPKALDRFKQRIREITGRAKGVSMETTMAELAPYMRGWRSYFGFCETPGVLVSLTSWVRRRLRCAMAAMENRSPSPSGIA